MSVPSDPVRDAAGDLISLIDTRGLTSSPREVLAKVAVLRAALDTSARPADDAVTLLADARKCVALCNTNGYYDVWLTRCDRVLANAKRSADERTANGGV